MPKIFKVAEVRIPEAECLADLYGIRSDIENAEVLCEKAVELDQGQMRDIAIQEGVVAAAVVRYCRCFTSGVRLGLKRSDLINLKKEDLELHDYFKNLRDKFIAHAVNAFEETYVTTTVGDGHHVPVRSLHAGRHTLMLWAGDAIKLLRLISEVKSLVDTRIVAEEKRLLTIIQALPVETIQSWDLHKPDDISESSVLRPRQRYPRT